jgi:hypothetical protein
MNCMKLKTSLQALAALNQSQRAIDAQAGRGIHRIFSSTYLVACRLLFVSSMSGLDGGCSGPGGVRGSPGAAGSSSRPAWNTSSSSNNIILMSDDLVKTAILDFLRFCAPSLVACCPLPPDSIVALSSGVSGGAQYPRRRISLHHFESMKLVKDYRQR